MLVALLATLGFALPAGFTDRTTDGAAQLEPLLASVGAPHGRVVKVGLDAPGGQVHAAMFAAVVDGPADEIVLPSPSELEHQVRMAAINQGVTLTSLRVARVRVGGVRAVRLVAEGPSESFDSHREIYFLPGDRQMGVVGYLVSANEAAAYAARFGAAIEQTTGLRAVPWWRVSFGGLRGVDLAKAGPIVLALSIGYFVFAARRRRRR